MKSLFLSIAVLAFVFAGCSGNESKEHDHNDGSHTHDDGSAHQHTEDVVKQEEFVVSADTSVQDAGPKRDQDAHEHLHKH